MQALTRIPASGPYAQRCVTVAAHGSLPRPIGLAFTTRLRQAQLPRRASHTSSEGASFTTQAVAGTQEDMLVQKDPQLSIQHDDDEEQPEASGTSNGRQSRGFQSASSVGFHIKNEWQQAEAAISKGDPATVLTTFYDRMEQHFLATAAMPDYTHFAQAIYGTAQLWKAAVAIPSFRSQQTEARKEMTLHVKSLLTKLVPLWGMQRSRHAASILWSCSKLGLSPDALVPGTVDALSQRFMQDLQTCNDRSFATFLTGVFELKVDPLNGVLLPAIAAKLAKIDMMRWHAQSLSVILFHLVKLGHADSGAVNVICYHYRRRLQSPIAAHKPDAGGVANFAWSLQRIKHVPRPELVTAMLNRMCQICTTEIYMIKTQHISKFLLACAELRFPVTQVEAATLVSQLLTQPDLNSQVLANATWSLALLGQLRLDIFQQLLQRYQVADVANGQLETNLRQMWSGLDATQPPEGADTDEQAKWEALQEVLESFSPRPVPRKAILGPEVESIYAILEELGLKYEKQALIGGAYYVHACINPTEGRVEPPILVQMGRLDTFKNDPSRPTGRANFFVESIGQHGKVVFVPLHLAAQNPEQLAIYLKPKLLEAAGGKLYAYTQ